MIARLARRLGFQPAVPVAAVTDWLMPTDADTVALAPRGGPATALVDCFGRVQPAGRSWTLDWTLAAGARWVPVLESERVTQRLTGSATLETTVQTPSGPVVQRVAAAVVDGQPVAIVEIENQGGVAIAVGIAARPLVHGGRGFLGEATVSDTAIELGDQGAVRFERAGASAVSDRVDLLAHMPDAGSGSASAAIRARAGGAQAAAVFPLPHTAVVRLVVELGEPVRSGAAVPTIDDVERGWGKHLESGLALAVGDVPLDERLSIAARGLLTSWPTLAATPAAITALAELGFGNDAERLFTGLDRVDDGPALMTAIARWAQLGDPQAQLDTLDRIIGPVARSIHEADAAEQLAGPPWLAWALGALGQRLDAIDQPDVADRVRGLRVTSTAAAATATVEAAAESGGHGDLLQLTKERAKLAPIADPATAAKLVLSARGSLLADRADGVDVLPALPELWRGRPIDVLRAPIEGGTISFGVRWHGARPALLWQVERDGGPFTVTASAIDPEFSSEEPSGETLLADPDWPRR